MKRKISMLLSIILVATSLIACDQTQVTETVSTPTPTVESAEPEKIAQSQGEGDSLTNQQDMVSVILNDTITVGNLDDINKFLDIISSSTISEEMPISSVGGVLVNATLLSDYGTTREFAMTGSYITEFVEGEEIYYLYNNEEDFNFVVNLSRGDLVPLADGTIPDFIGFYDEARLIFNQLTSSTLDLDFEQQAIIDDTFCFKVMSFNTFDELNSHLLTIFTKEIVDEFVLIEQSYIEYEGELYGIPSDVPTNMNIGKQISLEVIQEYPITTIKVEHETLENGDVMGSKTFEFICEFIDDTGSSSPAWIFTSFPNINS